MMAGQIIGYVRVSSETQNTARQDLPDCDIIYEEKASGKTKNRPELAAMMKHVRAGDTVVVHSIDRLARSLIDLQEIVDELVDNGVLVKFLKEGLEFSKNKENPSGKLMLQVLGGIAEFERNILRSRQREGIEKAKEKGKYNGRQRSVDYNVIRDLWDHNPTRPLKVIGKHLGISATSVYRALSTHQPYLDRAGEIRNPTPHERAKAHGKSDKAI